MSVFRFRCQSSRTRLPLEAEVFLEDRTRGFTPAVPEGWLTLETAMEGPVRWFAFLYQVRIARGESLGGDFDIVVDETNLSAEPRPSDFDTFEAPPPSPRD